MNTNRDEAPEIHSSSGPTCAQSESALKSYMGERRKPNALHPDEKGADWIILPLISTYRLGFWPVAGRYSVRTLAGGR